MNLMIVPGILVCSSFLISVCMFIVLECFSHIECYSDCSRRGSHLVEPLCYGAVKCVQCRHFRGLYFVPCVAWVCLQLCKEKDFSSVFAITERRYMGLYEVPLSMSLLGFGMGTMLANFHMCGIKSSFNMLVRNAGPRGPMCLGA